MKTHGLIRLVLTALLSLLTFGGASTTVNAQDATGFVRIDHLSPSAPGVDIYLNDAQTPDVANLQFGEATAFLALPAGSYRVAVRPTGAEATSAPVFRGNFRVTAGQTIDVAAIGQLQGRGVQAFRLITIPLNVSDSQGKARVYIVHASPDAPAFDVLGADNAVLVRNLPFGQFTRTPLEVDPGTYSYKLVATRTAEPSIISLDNLELKPNTVYVVYASGVLATIKPIIRTALTLRGEVPPTPLAGAIRVTHASPGAPNVDVYLNGSSVPAITNLAFGASSDLISLPTANYLVSIRSAGDPPINPPLFEKRLTLPAGVTAEVVALGVVGGEPAFDVAVFPIDTKPTNGKARVYVIHAGTSVPSVDIRVNGQLIVTGLKFGSYTTTPLEVNPGEYTATGVETGKTFPVVVSVAAAQLEADTIYTVIAYGNLIRTSPLLLTAKPAAQ